MLKKYKNRLFKIIKEMGLDPNDFVLKISKGKDNRLSSIYPKRNILFSFNFKEHDSNFKKFMISYKVFEKNYPLYRPSKKYEKFNILKIHFKYYLDEVLKYIEEEEWIDLWNIESVQDNQFSIKNIDLTDNESFTNSQKNEVVLLLDKSKDQIAAKVELNHRQLDTLNSSITYLTASLTRSTNKSDWQNLLIGTIIGLITNLGVDTETGQMIWTIFKETFSTLYLN